MFKRLSPKENLKVYNPATKLFLSDGEEVEFNQYWRRRMREGDVFEYKEKKQVVKENKRVTRKASKED